MRHSLRLYHCYKGNLIEKLKERLTDHTSPNLQKELSESLIQNPSLADEDKIIDT